MLPNIDRLAQANCVREPTTQHGTGEKLNINEKDFRGIFLNRHAHARHQASQQQQQQQQQETASKHPQPHNETTKNVSELVFYDHMKPYPLNTINWSEWCGSKRDIRCFHCAEWVNNVYPLCVPVDFQCGIKHDEKNTWKMRPHFAHWKCVYEYVNTRYNTFAARSVGLITLMGIRLYELSPLILLEETKMRIPNAHSPRLDHITSRNHTIVIEQAHVTIQDVYKSVPQTTNGGVGSGGGGSVGAAHDDDDDA